MAFVDDLDHLPQSPSTPAERLRQALDMHDFGVRLQRDNFRRRHPDASELQIDELIASWLLREDEPAEDGR